MTIVSLLSRCQKGPVLVSSKDLPLFNFLLVMATGVSDRPEKRDLILALRLSLPISAAVGWKRCKSRERNERQVGIFLAYRDKCSYDVEGAISNSLRLWKDKKSTTHGLAPDGCNSHGVCHLICCDLVSQLSNLRGFTSTAPSFISISACFIESHFHFFLSRHL